MSIAGSVRNDDEAPRLAPPAEPALLAPPAEPPVPPRRRRPRLVRWEGLIPLVLVLGLLAVAWLLFGDWLARRWLQEAASQALGTEVDVGELRLDARHTALELRGVAIADPRDRLRNLVEADRIRLVLEAEPLLQRKSVIRSLGLRDLRASTARRTPARPAPANGYAAVTLRALDAWARQFDVPLLSLTPIDTIRSIVLDPRQLKSVQAALALAHRTDSTRQALRVAYAGLRIPETLDTAEALVTRLRAIDRTALDAAQVQAAVADVRRTAARVDSARRRVEALYLGVRGGMDTLRGDLSSLDDARKADYAFARGLLKLPSFEAPEIGQAMFGNVSIAEFQRALYWASLAREYVPPGLLPRETPGPKRLRMAGSTVHFVESATFPRFHLRRADLNLSVPGGLARGTYTLALSDLTTEPAIVGRPTLFAVRRNAVGSDVEQVRINGLLDHRGARPRDVVNASAVGVKVPGFPLPVLPYRAEPGRGTSELRLVLDGDRVSARWTLASGNVAWPATDSARVRRLNYLESLVARVITGVTSLDLEARLEGPVKSPALSVRSSLDRQVADRLKAVVGEEVAKAEAKVRAQVDVLVEEKTAPVRARIEQLQGEADQKVADARTRLETQRAKLDEQLKTLTGGLVKLPKVPDIPNLPKIPTRIPGVGRAAKDTTPAKPDSGARTPR